MMVGLGVLVPIPEAAEDGLPLDVLPNLEALLRGVVLGSVRSPAAAVDEDEDGKDSETIMICPPG